MEPKFSTSGNVYIIELEGRFDAYQTPSVSTWLTEHITPEASNLVIDLQKVNFVDSLALALLVKTIARCRENGGKLHLCGISNPVKIILELTHLNKIFDIFEDQAHAISAFQ